MTGTDVVDVFAERTWTGQLFLRGHRTVERQVGLRQGITWRTLTDGCLRSVSRCPPEGPAPHVGASGGHLDSDRGRAASQSVLDRCRSAWPELVEQASTATALGPELSVQYSHQHCVVVADGLSGVDTRTSWRAIVRLRDLDGREQARRSVSGAAPDGMDPRLLTDAMSAALDLAGAERAAPTPARDGRTVLLLPQAAGSFAHEIFGHLLETDAASWSLGARISSTDVTVLTDPLNPVSWARMSIDDEGVPCRTRPLVERGMVVGRLADRGAAARHGVCTTGDGRRSAFDRPVRTRQTHTALMPGTASVADLFAVEPDCLVVDSLVRGEVSPVTGMFACLFAHSWNGLPGLAPRGGAVWVRGSASEAAGRVLGVGRDVVHGEGRCGKRGDFVPVSFSAPAVLVGSLDVVGATE